MMASLLFGSSAPLWPNWASMVTLWTSGRPSVDPEGAEILGYFGRWCTELLGGPSEMFAAMDTDGSDSLDREEFVEALRNLGFFASAGLPPSIATEELVQRNLYAVLDHCGKGCIS